MKLVKSKRLRLGLASSITAGLALLISLIVLAHRFVEELSRPHVELPPELLTWQMPELTTEPPKEKKRNLLFQAADGTRLSGEFWAQEEPAPSVVLCHGYRVTKAILRPVAAMLHAHGFNVLLFDFRGHGDSDSVMTSGGNAEVSDLEAALEAARRQPETLPGKIIIHGFSMGAAVALLTPPQDDVVAIIADSSYAHLGDVLYVMVNLQLKANITPLLHPFLPLVAKCIVKMSEIVFRVRFGYGLIARPYAAFQRWKDPSPAILVIHDRDDQLVPLAHARRIEQQAKIRGILVETYFTSGGDHCGGYGVNPDLYVSTIQTFLGRHL